MAVIRMNFRSAALHWATDVIIALPAGLGLDGREHVRGGGELYKTMWLLHGGLGDGEEFINYTGIVRYICDAGAAAVMPTCEGCFFEEPFYGFVTEELPRVLRSLLPLSGRREDNIIAGLSHGGDCAMRAALEHPDRYASALIMSAAGTDHRGQVGEAPLRFDVFGLADRDLREGGPIPNLTFATGTGDRGFPFYVPVIERLEAMGLRVERLFEEGDGHSWPFWDKTLKRFIKEMSSKDADL